MAYYFELVDEKYNEIPGCFIADGSNKKSAINKAKKLMAEQGLTFATLVVNSLRTNNILDCVDIEL